MSQSLAIADVIQPPLHGIEEQRRPGDAVSAVAERASARQHAGTCLEDLIRSRVLPEVAASNGIRGARAHPRVAELAGLLLKDAAGPVETLLGQATAKTQSLLSLRTTLFEPVARLLGDMWLDDTCTEAAVILGLYLLQSAVRRLASLRPVHCAGGSPGRVLVALLPGETHLLGVALASDALHDGGWGVTVAFPADLDALMRQLRSERCDALHLTLSDVFRREESLPMLRRAVQMARSNAPDRTLRITVSGRMFAESRMRPGSVGADALLPHIA